MSNRDLQAHVERLHRSWTRNAAAWTQAVREGQIPSRAQGTDAAILGAVAASGAHRVLDVGCGEGWLVHALAREGYEAVGVDGSAPLIDAAREGEGHFLHLSYREITARPESLGAPFDAVVCNFSLLEEDLTPLLQALRTRLREAGVLFIQTVHPFTACGDEPYRDGWRVETFDSFGTAFAEPMPWYFRTVGSWTALLRSAGYRLERCLEPQGEGSARPLSLLLEGTTAGIEAP